jgi:hypothetical protein
MENNLTISILRLIECCLQNRNISYQSQSAISPAQTFHNSQIEKLF